MKEHTSNFETEIKTYGRQQAVQVIFEQDGQEVVLDNENVFSATPNFKASLLKSAMKSLILDCNVEIPVGTRLQFKYGILVNNAYEYLNFGYYIVNKIEKKEDTRSYEITCYDKMMLTMVDYIDLGIEYPITIRNYIAEICNHLEIDFGSNQDQFVNYDKEILNELYLDENGNSLDYTFRDVLDELAQVTASVICIDENDNLVVKYPQLNGDYETIEGTSLYIENADDNKIDLELKGNTTQDGTPTPSSPVPVNNVTGEQVVRVCGKNLIEIDKQTTTQGGLTFTINEDKSVSVTGTYSSSVYFSLFNSKKAIEPSTTYTLSGAVSSSARLRIRLFNQSQTQLSEYYLQNKNGYTFTTPSNAYYYDLYIVMNAVGEDNTFYPQLEVGSLVTEYEPYQSKDYEINLGANILDIQNSWVNNKNQTSNGLRYILNEDDTISISGTSTNYSDAYARSYNSTNVFMTLKANHTYRLLVEVSDKTSNINSRVFFGTTSANISDFSIPTMVENGIYYKDYVPTEDIGLTQYSVIGAQSVGETSLTMKIAIYDVTTNLIDKYTKYFTPIELNKIGDYQDFIKKGTGKNLFNKDKEVENYFYNASGVRELSNDTTFINQEYNDTDFSSIRMSFIQKVGTPYVRVCEYNSNGTFIKRTLLNTNNQLLNFDSNTKKVIFSTNAEGFTNLQIEKGTTATLYEPYGYKNKWYIEKNIGKIVLDGSESWTTRTASTGAQLYETSVSGFYSTQSITMGYSNQYIANISLINDNTFRILKGITLALHNDTIGSISNLKTFLSSNNLIVYYPLANTTYTLIENEELIEQLDRIYLQQGLNNVLVSGNLPSTLKMTYVSDLIGIDEEQLKDINVNFGEKYGPINSLVIARAADSDFIYKEDEKSVAEDGLCEVKISDNQILNGDNRTQFIDEMFNQLKGTEFYLNDFSSTGITYLDLLDYYKVKVFDNYYKCLMLNDEINITQGLQEQVFTERPKESETEYKSIAKQDKDIRKIGIIVNKVEGEITAEIIARQDTDEKVSNLTQTIGEISTTVSTTTTQVNDLETRVQTNETSISQNSDSITATISRIQQTEDDVETLQTNTEDVIKQLVFGDDGLTISAKGTTSDDMKLNLTNDAIKFLYQNNAVLTINGSTIEFSNASFKKLDLGNYVWQAEDDDSLSLIYEGD